MTADEIFEKLGYEKIINDNNKIHYITQKGLTCGYRSIEFRLRKKIIVPYNKAQIDMETLQAINQKCKELGWI